MKRVVLVTANKGGVGKSTFARALLDRYRRQGVNVAPYDADGAVGQLVQYYGRRDEQGHLVLDQRNGGVESFDIRNDAQRDMVLNAIDTGPGARADVILFDLPGGVLHELGKVVDHDRAQSTGLVAEYASAGFRPTVVIVITPMLASVRTVTETLQRFGDQVDYVVVKSCVAAAPEDFVLFDGFDENGSRCGGHGKQLLQAHQGIVIHMPALNGRTYALLDVGNYSFSEAKESPKLVRADRSRVHQWLTAMDHELDKAKEFLGL